MTIFFASDFYGEAMVYRFYMIYIFQPLLSKATEPISFCLTTSGIKPSSFKNSLARGSWIPICSDDVY